MSQPGAATATPTPVLEPGQTGQFIYVGELIPNQVFITNLSNTGAEYWLESGAEGWRFFGLVGAGETASIQVQWFTGIATFSNISLEGASIEIGGDGIFPYDATIGGPVNG